MALLVFITNKKRCVQSKWPSECWQIQETKNEQEIVIVLISLYMFCSWLFRMYTAIYWTLSRCMHFKWRCIFWKSVIKFTIFYVIVSIKLMKTLQNILHMYTRTFCLKIFHITMETPCINIILRIKHIIFYEFLPNETDHINISIYQKTYKRNFYDRRMFAILFVFFCVKKL